MCTDSISAFASIAPPPLASSLRSPSEAGGVKQAGPNAADGNSPATASTPQYGVNEATSPTVNASGQTVGALLHVAA